MKELRFFETINWIEVEEKETTPPFVPPVSANHFSSRVYYVQMCVCMRECEYVYVCVCVCVRACVQVMIIKLMLMIAA